VRGTCLWHWSIDLSLAYLSLLKPQAIPPVVFSVAFKVDPCVPVPPNRCELGVPGLRLDAWHRAPIIDHHDRVLIGEGRRVAFS
jgi:hypothetical protein